LEKYYIVADISVCLQTKIIYAPSESDGA